MVPTILAPSTASPLASAPLLKTQTTYGEVGATVNILGTDLTGATNVTFNGTAATFSVNSTGTESLRPFRPARPRATSK